MTRRLLTSFSILLVCLMALGGVAPAAADAHRGLSTTAKAMVVNSNMHGRCGNGWAWHCIGGTKYARWVGYADAHSHRLTGTWVEWRPFYSRRCYASFVAGPHGMGSWGEVCYRL